MAIKLHLGKGEQSVDFSFPAPPPLLIIISGALRHLFLNIFSNREPYYRYAYLRPVRGHLKFTYKSMFHNWDAEHIVLEAGRCVARARPFSPINNKLRG